MSRSVTHYLGLIMPQHQGAPKFRAWVAAQIQVFVDIAQCAETMKYYFSLYPVAIGNLTTDSGEDITTDAGEWLDIIAMAFGAQLDILGEIVGVKRHLPFQPSGGVSPRMDDDTYRTAIKAKIGLNHWDGRINSLQPLWQQIFPTGKIIVQDNHDMTMTVTLYGEFSSIVVDLITHGMVVPRPQGVGINYLYGDLPYFGCDLDNDYIAGADKGHAA